MHKCMLSSGQLTEKPLLRYKIPREDRQQTYLRITTLVLPFQMNQPEHATSPSRVSSIAFKMEIISAYHTHKKMLFGLSATMHAKHLAAGEWACE